MAKDKKSVKFSLIFISCIDILKFTFEIRINNVFLKLISFISFYFLKMWLLENFELCMWFTLVAQNIFLFHSTAKDTHGLFPK